MKWDAKYQQIGKKKKLMIGKLEIIKNNLRIIKMRANRNILITIYIGKEVNNNKKVKRGPEKTH